MGIGLLSWTVWAHHMFTTGKVLLPFFAFMTTLIAIPTGVKMFNWLATLWRGSISLTTPMLFALGFISMFLIGGISGVMLAQPRCSRTFYAFSRDRAVPGWRFWTKLNHNRVPIAAVLAVCAFALIMTLPALWNVEGGGIPVAFFAVVSIAVIGLYIAYVIPVYLRLRAGDAFERGSWNLGEKYRWMCTIAVIWVSLCVIIFCLPFTPAAVPWNDEFSWSALRLRAAHRGRALPDRRPLVAPRGQGPLSRAQSGRSSSTRPPA